MENLEQKEKEKILKLERDKEWKKFQVKVKDQKYMHQKLEEDYKKNVEMPELEKKKNELKEKREFYKPINRAEIDEFQKKYEENYKKKLEEKRQVREQWYDEMGVGKHDVDALKSKVYEKVVEEERHHVDPFAKEKEDKRKKAEKMNNYARIVKEMHVPEVSERKKRELEQVKKLMSQRNQRRSAPPNQRHSIPKANETNMGSEAGNRPNWKQFHNPLIPKPKPKREPIVVDYLQEARAKREETDSKTKHSTAMDWDAIKDDKIDDKTKIELLKARTRLIEENAKRKEQMNKVNGNSVEDNVDINDMLIDAIEMKLSILDQIE